MAPFPVDSIVSVFANITLAKEAMAKEAGLNLSQYMTMLLVGASRTLSCKDLKDNLDLPGSSTTFVLDSLEDKGLISRIRSKRDRRQYLIELTPDGDNLCRKAMQAETERADKILGTLTSEERLTFFKIANSLSQAAMHKKMVKLTPTVLR